ncbi:DNA-damage-inducible protein D [Ktedonobacter racemifer]|uniref:DNA-damage-inducible protein D n=1 Tax=Ktedonobacter racemifer TaxID=363277 RepID=UPI0012F95E70|nr:DNA-damage-inducible protein D [Ktedonobacter racemifer]
MDNMGREELAANYFRITQTEGKLIREQLQEEDRAIEAHHDVGSEVRKAIEAINAPMPEDLPRAASIRKMVEERRRASRKRLKKDQGESGQEKLF